jgi:phosphohistidine phosphatase
MRRLILFRHAKAEPRGAGEDDFDRPLSPRGWDDAALVGRALADAGLDPDLALVSPARRTTETWISAREALGAGARVELAPALYNADVDQVLGAIDGASGTCETLIVVGHNPGLHEAAVQLLEEAAATRADVEQVAGRFPTATAAVYAFDPAGRASLESLLLARELGGEGEG